jgi:hypothetical protein
MRLLVLVKRIELSACFVVFSLSTPAEYTASPQVSHSAACEVKQKEA